MIKKRKRFMEMSLITCPECGKQVSDMAQSCINCGYPLIQELKKKIEYEEQKRSDGEREKVELPFSLNLPKGYRIEKDGKKFFVYKNGEVNYVGDLPKLVIKNIKRPTGTRMGSVTFTYVLHTLKFSVESEEQIEKLEFLSKLFTQETENSNQKKEEFTGIYKVYPNGSKKEIYCPRCGSIDCSYFTEQKVTHVPVKTKAKYSLNLNPLKPFTIVNKKEKTIKRDIVRDVSKIKCNKCGEIFE